MVPPADIRYLKRAAAPNLGGDSATGRIVAHLQQLYESVAETLPDFRGETDVVMAKRGEIGLEDELEDSYAEGLKSSTKEFEDPNSFVTGRTRKKRRRKSVVVDPEKVPPREPRWLPPGATMKDYWEQMNLVEPHAPVSFPNFGEFPGYLQVTLFSRVRFSFLG